MEGRIPKRDRTIAVITAITFSHRRSSTCTIKVDGRTVATLSPVRIEKLALHVGQDWTGSLARRVARAAEGDKAERDALQHLNRRAMSRRQLAEKLRQLEHREAVLPEILDRLETSGWLNDEALGRALIQQITHRKPAGRKLLQIKLTQRGLDEILVDRLVDEHENHAGLNHLEQALNLVRQRTPALAHCDHATRTRRLAAFLARRGFDPDTIEQALESRPSQVESHESMDLPFDP